MSIDQCKLLFPMQNIYLLCFIHAKDSIVKKCTSLGIEPKIYINEIFGVKVGETKVKGLLDCTSKKDFEKQYQKLKKIWETRPNGNKFVSYIEKNGPGKLSLKETISLLQKEVRGQEENVKFALLGKGKVSLPDNI